jgi:hypothetical protein
MSVGQKELGGTTRRAVVRAGVWTIPVVAATAAAPAFAASPCATDTAVWSSGWTNGAGKIVSGTSRVVGHATVTMSYSGDVSAANNATVYTAGQTGGVSNALRFWDQNNKANTAQTVTIQFDKTVTNVSLTLLDVDSATNSFYDQVAVTPAGFTAVKGSQVIGTGTAADPFNGSTTNTAVAGTSTNGNVQLTWAAGLTQITFTYSQGGTATGSPFIGISNMAFQAQDC